MIKEILVRGVKNTCKDSTIIPQIKKIHCNFNSDEKLETLSLACDDVQIIVPFEQIEKLINEVRQSK